MRRLPPMNAVRAFEAAVRLGSFTAAAKELGVSQGAVSRQVKIIEGFLGASLYVASGHRLQPTERAREYALDLRAALDRIGLATQRMTEPAGSRLLRVNAKNSFAMHWLIPRLPLWQARYPSIDVRISLSWAPIDQIGDPFDVAIRRHPMAFPGYESRVLLDDVRLPVCTPEVLARHPVQTPADLPYHTLLRTEHSTAWDTWLALAGIDVTVPVRSLHFESFFVALQAANDGLGFAIAPLAFVAGDLAKGRLVAPLPEPVVPCRPIEMLYPIGDRSSGRTAAFVNWLLEQAQPAVERVAEPIS